MWVAYQGGIQYPPGIDLFSDPPDERRLPGGHGVRQRVASIDGASDAQTRVGTRAEGNYDLLTGVPGAHQHPAHRLLAEIHACGDLRGTGSGFGHGPEAVEGPVAGGDDGARRCNGRTRTTVPVRTRNSPSCDAGTMEVMAMACSSG